MPSLSIIIPHQQQQEALENTILSVLENRPRDSEIIVVHDGSYDDPYQLGDELIYVINEKGSRCVPLLNAGLMAACSPVVATLLSGVQVGPEWADAAVAAFAERNIASLAVPVRGEQTKSSCYGVNAEALDRATALQTGRVEQDQSDGPVAGPLLTCGFYLRKPLLALNGWDDRLDASIADVELAWAFRELKLGCEVCTESDVVSAGVKAERHLDNVATKQLAELAVAYRTSPGGAKAAMSDLLHGCLSGQVSASVAWATGIMHPRADSRIADRLEQAVKRLTIQPPSEPLRLFPTAEQGEVKRRAA